MGGTFLKAGLEDGEGRINRLRIFFYQGEPVEKSVLAKEGQDSTGFL
jgi:hypothetical protein